MAMDMDGAHTSDMQKPDIGRQKTEKLIQSDRVDFIAGYIWSNVLLASARSVLDAGLRARLEEGRFAR